MDRERYYEFEIDLKSSPAALWPFAADTNRFNLDIDRPPVTRIWDAPDIPAGKRRLEEYLFGFYKVVWDEDPFEWVFPHHVVVTCHYKEGPLAYLRAVLDLTDRAEGGTHIRSQIWARGTNFLTGAAMDLQFKLYSLPLALKTLKNYDEIIQRGGSHYDIGGGEVRFAPGGQERLLAAKAAIVQKESDEVIFDGIKHLLESADDLALQKLRPYQLADLWKLPRRDVLEAFLHASRAGLLDFRWDLLCPSCRGASVSHASLAEVHNSAHCAFCDIDYTVNFDRQVEVIFRPNPSVRIIPEQLAYCLTGPQTEPHLYIHQTVTVGQTLETDLVLQAGRYSLSSYNLEGEWPVIVQTDGPNDLEIIVNESGWPDGELALGLNPHLKLKNNSTVSDVFMLQRTAWRDDAATAADVTSLQLFRDLFSREALRPGEEIQMNSVTLMFTDLRDSTRLYRQIGDAAAFGRVRQHFDLLEQAIAAENGAVVKTIGDSVMAVFRHPGDAIRAVKAAHDAIAQSEGNPSLMMKAGIHTGPCIVVTLNERLDYFGSTVNIAARLSGLAEGGDVVFSNEIKTDPETESWLRENHPAPTWFESPVKGYDQPFSLWRMPL